MLTVLSLGVGQDSVALLFEIMNNEEFRIKYNIDLKEFICITAETGNEHNHTYQYRDYLESYCSSRNIPYYIIGFDNGFQSGSWTKGLISFYEKTTTVGSKVFRKTCTDNLKIKPIYRFLNYYVIERYNLIDELYEFHCKRLGIKP